MNRTPMSDERREFWTRMAGQPCTLDRDVAGETVEIVGPHANRSQDRVVVKCSTGPRLVMHPVHVLSVAGRPVGA